MSFEIRAISCNMLVILIVRLISLQLALPYSRFDDQSQCDTFHEDEHPRVSG
jgi:hypothetical protein